MPDPDPLSVGSIPELCGRWFQNLVALGQQIRQPDFNDLSALHWRFLSVGKDDLVKHIAEQTSVSASRRSWFQFHLPRLDRVHCGDEEIWSDRLDGTQEDRKVNEAVRELCGRFALQSRQEKREDR